MATAAGCPSDALLHVSTGEQYRVQEVAKQLGLQATLILLQILDQTIARLKYLAYPRTVAEMALVRICSLEDVESVPQLISQLREGAPMQVARPPTAPNSAMASGVGSPSTIAASKKKYNPSVAAESADKGLSNGSSAPNQGAHANGNGYTPPIDEAKAITDSMVTSPSSEGDRSQPIASQPLAPAVAKLSDIEALELWRQAAQKLGGLAAEKALQASGAAISAPNQLVVEFPKRYNFCRQFCDRPEILLQLARIIEDLAGSALRLEFRLSEDEPVAPLEPERTTTLRQRMYDACQRPFVQQAMELFNATAQRLDESNKLGG
jgi:DNA polymerase-3 subunit gamma/tau